MPLPPFDPDEIRAAFAAHGAHVALAEGEDLDEAFDGAVTTAYNDPSAAQVFTTRDPDAVIETGAVHSLDEALAAALAWVHNQTRAAAADLPNENPPADGESDDPDTADETDVVDAADGDALVSESSSPAVAAFAVLGRSAHARTTRRARVEGVEFEPEMGPSQPWTALADDLSAAVAAVDAGPAEGEVLERVTIARRARYKVVATTIKGASVADHAVLAGSTILTRGHKTASDAQKAAVAHLKSMGVEDHAMPTLEVIKLSGREDGQPMRRIERTRTMQKLTMKLVYATRKPSAKEPKIVGWVFVTL